MFNYRRKNPPGDALRIGWNFRQHIFFFIDGILLLWAKVGGSTLICSFKFICKMSVEISSDIYVSVCKYPWYYAFSSRTSGNFPLISYICLQHVDGNFQRHFLKFFWKIPMIFAFAFKTSVKLLSDSLILFAKCRWKFLSTSFYLLKISMVFCFCLAKRRWKISSILCRSISNMSMEISIDILLLSVNQNRICEVFSQICRVINLQKTNSFYSNALLRVKI